MTTHPYILATAGHVDHGKSALVKALTGTDPDRLPEEKARGITIDLGFAHLELSTHDPEPTTYRLGVVDVPGHEDFIKNMVAGVGSIDVALLVVAADDGWMPQTEEHLQILSYLGVSHAVVALTKADLVQDVRAASEALRARLQGSAFAQVPIVPTSIVENRGLEELQTALLHVLQQTPPPRDIGKPRLPVDRVFVLRGIGTVVTGTLTGGVLRQGQAVVVQPRGQATRIRSLQSHNRDLEAAGPGMRTAVNLPDVEAGAGVRRGDVLTLPGIGGATDTLDVVLERSPRLLGLKVAAARPLKDGALVRLHLGSAESPARLAFIGADVLLPDQRIAAQARLEMPLQAFAGDRFIIRDWSEQATLAGGAVLDPEADRRSLHAVARKTFLETRMAQPDQVDAFVRSQLLRDGVVARTRLLGPSRFSAGEVADSVSRIARDNRAVIFGELVAEAGWWESLRERAVAAIEAHQQQHPEQAGLPLADLRTGLQASLSVPGVFEGLVAGLCGSGFTQAGVAICRTGHRPALPPQLQAPGAKVRAALSAKPLDPPSRKELAPDGPTRQALRFLFQTGEAVELSEEVVMGAEAFATATEAICVFLKQRGRATTSELRQALDSSRRVVIPLLEHLDKAGVTRREGDLRALREP